MSRRRQAAVSVGAACALSLIATTPASAWQAGTGDGVITVTADPGEANRIDVDVAPDGRIVVSDAAGAPRILGPGCVRPEDEQTATCDRTGATRLVIDGGDLDDTVDVAEVGLAVTVRGGTGNDTVTTSSGDDVLDGGAGNDTLDSGAGADTVGGGDGDDRLSTGTGDDTVSAGAGGDVVDADEGADRIDGGDGDDRLSGGIGNDSVDAGAGTDTVDTDLGDDRLSGGAGSDQLDAGPGDDVVSAGDGDDDVTGGDGDDVLGGDAGRDRIGGDEGADRIDGGAGDDDLDGGAAADVIQGGDGNDLLQATDGPDALSGGAGDDRLEGDDLDNALDGGDGNDTVNAYGGADRITGGAGDDTLDGGLGADAVSGGDGRDAFSYASATQGVRVSLNGIADDGALGEGDDVGADVEALTGSALDDVLVAGPAAVRLVGGGGNDRLTGSPQADVLSGGDGADTLDGVGGGDVLAGDEGSDTVTYADRRAALAVSVGSGADDGQRGEGDDVRSDVERVLGGGGADVLTAASGLSVRFDGGTGSDRITFPEVSSVDATASGRAVCGTGTDTVVASAEDVVSADCDIVTTDGRLTRFTVQGEGSPRLRVTVSKVQIGKDGRLRVPVYCASESGVRCRTGVHVDRAFKPIGRRTATVGRGRNATILVPLKRAAARKLRARGGAVRLELRVRDKSGATARGVATVAVKVPGQRSKTAARRAASSSSASGR